MTEAANFGVSVSEMMNYRVLEIVLVRCCLCDRSIIEQISSAIAAIQLGYAFRERHLS